ncbi:MAG: putative molybdenum carrier protein [Planctomycetales bacterium]|nr:putative molybdenum carrier protein [Planctomycetales bacterium]
MSSSPPLTIVSGGQTGADRAALDYAIHSGLPHDGWCPRGRRAEDGPLPPRYALQETPSPGYAERTEWNVRDSDATVVFALQTELTGGTRLTAQLAERMQRPLLVLAADAAGPLEAAVLLRQFLSQHKPARLNVAGPRASQQPEIAAYVDAVLAAAL